MSGPSPDGSRSPGGDGPVSAVVDAWCTLDQEGAFLASDREVVESSRTVRALIVEALGEDPDGAGHDVIHAFGSLGRALADGGASPSLIASTVDTLLVATGSSTPTAGARPARSHAFVLAGRAALFESYVHAIAQAHAEAARAAWEYPACAVQVPDGVAVAAGHPVDDAEALAAWASRVGHAVALSGARRVIASGERAALRALQDALEVAGIELVERAPLPLKTRPARR